MTAGYDWLIDWLIFEPLLPSDFEATCHFIRSCCKICHIDFPSTHLFDSFKISSYYLWSFLVFLISHSVSCLFYSWFDFIVYVKNVWDIFVDDLGTDAYISVHLMIPTVLVIIPIPSSFNYFQFFLLFPQSFLIIHNN